MHFPTCCEAQTIFSPPHKQSDISVQASLAKLYHPGSLQDIRVALELLQCQGLCFLPYLTAAKTVPTAGYEPAKATDHKEFNLLCHISQLECLFSVVNDPYSQQNTVLGQTSSYLQHLYFFL